MSIQPLIYPTSAAIPARKKSGRILVFESNPADSRLIEEAFRECKASCRLAFVTSHSEALTALSSQEFDLFLSAFGNDVRVASNFLRAVSRQVPSMPIVVLSGLDASTITDNTGVSAHLKKPNDLQEFFSLIESICRLWLHPYVFGGLTDIV